MKYTAIILITVLLSGCSHTVPVLQQWYDSQDPCQTQTQCIAQHRPAQCSALPNWCGASQGRRVITNTQGTVLGYIR